MNWYKRFKSAQMMMVDAPTSIDKPPDIDDGDDDDDGYDWGPCHQVIQKWVVDNIGNDPLATIQNQIVEEIAIFSFQQGIYPEVMLWHEDLDFFKTQQHRAMTVYLRFAGFHGTPSGEDAEHAFFDMASKQSEWQGLLRQSTLLQTIQGAGCQVAFIDSDLYEFVLGEVCNAICYRNKQVAETFQTYLETNIEKMHEEIIQMISMGELSRFIGPEDFAQITIGNEIADVTNAGMRCSPSDFRFDAVGIVLTAELTMYLDVPGDISERVLQQFGEDDEEFE